VINVRFCTGRGKKIYSFDPGGPGAGNRNGHILCHTILNPYMEKRVFGVILTVLGIAGLIIAAYQFVQGNTTTNHSIRSVVMYGILGLIFFFAGLGLIRSTRDLSNRE
jgi:uncharacterized membrane protein